VTATVVGVIAVAGAYMASSGRNADLTPPNKGSTIAPLLLVGGAYRLEVGPFALPWTWLGDRGTLVVRGAAGGTSYIAFRAMSNQRRRTVRIGGAPSKVVDLLPRAYLAGPLKLVGDIPIRVSPSAERASKKDRRRVSVFVSTPVAVRTPFAGLPGKGFYPEERSAGRRFNWMSERGVLDLVGRIAANGSANVRLVLWAPAERRVIVARSDGGTRRTVLVRAGRPKTVVIDAVRMRAGHGRLILRTAGTVRSRDDSRRLSLQLLGVTRVR